MKWSDLSMAERAKYIKLGVQSGITNLNNIRNIYNSFAEGGQYSAGKMVNTLYESAAEVESLGEPEHHYDFTQSEEWANAHGYYPDERGHRDDRVKKPAHPTHPSKGKWNGLNEFQLTDLGMEDPNYIMFGMADGDQDPQAILTYKGAIVLPEITVTPKGNYIHNSYDNLNIRLKKYAKGITVTPNNKFGGGGKKKNYRIARLNSSGKPVIDYSIPAFNSEEEMDSYIKNNNLQQVFVEELPELVVKHPDLIAKEQAQEANWTDRDKERYARMMESTGWKADTDFADKAIEAEQRARNINQGAVLGQLASGLNVLSPSQQFGAIVDWAQGEKGYWEGIGGGNSGFFTDEYAKEHPIVSTIGNMIADGIVLNNINKGINVFNKNNVKEFTPTQTTARLRQDSGNFEVGQTTTLEKLLSREKLDNIKSFMTEDVAPRLKNAMSDEARYITPEEKELIDLEPSINTIFNNIYKNGESTYAKDIKDWVENTPVSIIAPSDKYRGFADLEKNIIKIPINEIKNINTLDQTIVHELEHLQRSKLQDFISSNTTLERMINYDNNNIQSRIGKNENGIYIDRINRGNLTYTPEETNILDNAYRFSDDYLLKNNLTPILEKGATNRELRYKLSEMYHAKGEELNKIINTMHYGNLINILGSINGYGRNFVNWFNNLSLEKQDEIISNIRKSLQYVGSAGLGIAALDNINSK